jgi:hypothetical protein
MTSDRGPLELTDREHAEMERLMAAAGIRTKGELVARALALFGWVTDEVAAGGVVASIPPAGQPVKRLELPTEPRMLTLADLIPPAAPKRLGWWPRPLRGRTADELLADLSAPFPDEGKPK